MSRFCLDFKCQDFGWLVGWLDFNLQFCSGQLDGLIDLYSQVDGWIDKWINVLTILY